MRINRVSDEKMRRRESFLDRVESGDAEKIREVCDQCNPPEEMLAQVMVILLGKGDDKVTRAKAVFMCEASAHADWLLAAGKFDA